MTKKELKETLHLADNPIRNCAIDCLARLTEELKIKLYGEKWYSAEDKLTNFLFTLLYGKGE